MVIICKRDPEVCDLLEFKINGIPAVYLDFGVTEDLCPEEKGCGNRQFVPDEEIPKHILKKYHILESEIDTVLDTLRKELAIGPCRLCVRNEY